MIVGCTSDAGKSFLVTALCRILSNRGVRVAPFKAQNMSNNAAVTRDGLEMGRAQWVQALAARTVPDVRMNPILLKPTADTHSQVIVLGRYHELATRTPWLERKPLLWPIIRDALASLRAEYDQLVIEGAGSPAEVNLRDSDLVNLRVARECDADAYLVADIDRGGAFAHLLGTWECLDSGERRCIRGFVLNKFRGDPKLLGNAMEWLEQRTGVPTAAIVPFMRHAIPEEDALHHRARFRPGQLNVALVVYPYASNLDEFDPLVHTPGVNVVPIFERQPLTGYAAVLLPGSKNTAASLQHLRTTGLADDIVAAAAHGIPVYGICGGMQLLGRRCRDPHALEGGDFDGLGLLELETTLVADKITTCRETRAEDGSVVKGYEIHHGRTTPGSSLVAHLEDGLGWRTGNVTGIYLHGVFENGDYRRRFLERLGWVPDATASRDWSEVVETEIERAAAVVEASGWRL
jgi:adenosylcobyric acid synthase